MPINSSGAISLGASASTTRLNSVGSRLFVADGSALDMNNATLRNLAGVSTTSGDSYSMSNFYSKPSWAYSSYYDCSSFSGWTTSVNQTGNSARQAVIYSAAHWQMSADGNSVPYIYQTRDFGSATTFDIQFDVMNNDGSAPLLQLQIAASSGLAGTGFRYTSAGIDYCSFGSSTDTGSVGGNLISWFGCNGGNLYGQLRTGLWTRLRFVGSRSGSTWSGTVTAIAAYYDSAVLGSANFSFNASGNVVGVRTFANEDGAGEACYVDNVWVTVD